VGSVAGRHCKFQYNILSGHLLITMNDKWPNSSHLFEPFMSHFLWVDSCVLDSFVLISTFVITHWHCVIHRWGLHFGSMLIPFMQLKIPFIPLFWKNCPFLKSWHNSCNPSKGWDLIWSTLKGFIFISWCGDIWSLALASGQISTLMC